MWDKLLTLYDQDDLVKKHVSQQQFFTYKWERKGITHHITELKGMRENLDSMGDNLK